MSDVLETWHSAPNPEELVKSMEKSDVILPKSAIVDPLQSAYTGGTRTKPTAVPYSTLRRMAQVPAIAAVINTRLNQVAAHAKRPKFSGDKGFKIALKDRDEKMSDADKKIAKGIEDFFLKTGWSKNRLRKDNFNQFLRKITRDTLTLDVMTIEKVNKMKGALKGKFEVAEVWAIDAATIELVANNPVGEGYKHMEPPVYKPETRSGLDNIGEIAYVQKVGGVVTAEYTEDELAFAIRNPRTDLDYTDFGFSELETLMEIITGIVNGVRYNTSYFSSSHLPQGVLSIVGKYDDKHLKAFQRHWKTLTEGAAGKWSVPVMATEDGTGFNWTPFKNSNRDMEFNQFLEFLFNVACAVYQIDPNEVGFKSWTSGTSMTQSDNTAEKNEMSKDKGFEPLMSFLSDTFNSEIVDLIDDRFEFQWVGVSDEDEDARLERQTKEMEAGIKTASMIWAENDMDVEELKAQNGGKLPDWAYAPANAQLIQVFTAGMQAEQQQQQAEQQGQQQQAQAEQQAQLQQQSADDQHKKQLEIMDKQHGQTMEQKNVDQLHDRNKLVNTHKQGMEAKQADQKHQVNLEKLKAQQNMEGKQADQKHQVNLEKLKAQHGMEGKTADQKFQKDTSKETHDRGMESKKVDHAHQKEMAKITAEQKAKEAQKKTLKKSIEDEFQKAGFDIDWGDY